MKILGSDGSEKYLLIDNKITDLRKQRCTKCIDYVKDGEHLVCRVCKCILEEPVQEDNINGNDKS
jgi:hypothetical protein